MRHTLSVLTAVCLLALGQPAWSEVSDREVARRAHSAAMALPDAARACASKLLQQLQALHTTAATNQRSLRLQPMFHAATHALRQHYATTAQAHTLAHALLPAHSYANHTITTATPMHLDPAMVHRWLAPWLMEEIA